MKLSLESFNHIPEQEARVALHDCCASIGWGGAMTARRPFKNEADLLLAAEEIWWRLGEADWLEAFAGHPQIGAGA